MLLGHILGMDSEVTATINWKNLIGRTLVIWQHLITGFEKRKVKACEATFPFSQKYYSQSVPVFSQYPLS